MPISQQEYAMMMARELARTPAEVVRVCRIEDAVEREGNLHDEIIKHCREHGWLYFHGSMAHKTYRTEGEPDFHIWADGGRKFAFECKSRSGKLSTKQLGVIAHAKQLGHTVHAVGSMAEFRELVAVSKLP